MGRKKQDAIQRFWSKVEQGSSDQCWEWQGGRYPAGYGQFWNEGRNLGAHLYSFILHKGQVPMGMKVCHSCDNPPCVNPNHLFLGTAKDNTQDMIQKGRLVRTRTLGNYATGARNHKTKLSQEQADEIRRVYSKGKRGSGLRILAQKYNVAPNTIRQIIHWQTKKG